MFDELRRVIDELEGADVDSLSVANEVRVLHHLKARLDAQIARRVDVLDRSGEWAHDGASVVRGVGPPCLPGVGS